MLFSDIDSGPYCNGHRYLAPPPPRVFYTLLRVQVRVWLEPELHLGKDTVLSGLDMMTSSPPLGVLRAPTGMRDVFTHVLVLSISVSSSSSSSREKRYPAPVNYYHQRSAALPS
ncbi:hypothetical protein EVAR_9422_1 [Eumeta japonica]|uniref:Uncharacterized protein n=1 Tax=Eumeta variegata TaxID=151549 RepID=A0A4C1UEG8_EUMVA|nr:hypothetical protein EVAR_9422_1 [Eumeta japonica]